MRPLMLKGHERSLTKVKYNREGDLLFSAAKDKSPCVWFSDNGERLGTYDVWFTLINRLINWIWYFRATMVWFGVWIFRGTRRRSWLEAATIRASFGTWRLERCCPSSNRRLQCEPLVFRVAANFSFMERTSGLNRLAPWWCSTNEIKVNWWRAKRFWRFQCPNPELAALCGPTWTISS